MHARVFVVSVLALSLSIGASIGCSKKVDEPADNFQPSQGTPLPPGPTKLITDDVTVGTGAEAKTGDKVKVQYTGTLMNGVKFDSSYDHEPAEPFEFTLGQGQVIKGWDQGVVGMKVGGKRKLTIPSDLAYGDTGHPPTIPGKAGLKFDVELVAVE
jgi:FKBP-type peptidyl-prolyl cis-trans isomerase FkpA